MCRIQLIVYLVVQTDTLRYLLYPFISLLTILPNTVTRDTIRLQRHSRSSVLRLYDVGLRVRSLTFSSSHSYLYSRSYILQVHTLVLRLYDVGLRLYITVPTGYEPRSLTVNAPLV